jgi:signal transduction histidine kinase
MMEQELERADGILIEGRNRVRDLRAGNAPVDICDALRATAQGFSLDTKTRFDLKVAGEVRDLHPVARDEISRIGCEAVINAYKHASATSIKASLIYGPDSLTLRVIDDGIGFETKHSDTDSRENRFGLTGMRERAARIHAKLAITGRRGKGTEVELIVPAATAYTVSGKWRRAHPLTHLASAS